MKLSITFIFMFCLVFSGCKTIEKKDSSDIININDISKYTCNEPIIDSIWTIKIETKENCIFGKADKIFFRNNSIYILDKKNISI
jgi:hypothetical protein